MKIITLTLNPAFDVHCDMTPFAPYTENFGSVLSREAGGKGVNISRALASHGKKSAALIALGSDGGEQFKSCLANYGLDCVFTAYNGRIRENITLHTQGMPETRISLCGSPVTEQTLKIIEKEILSRMDTDTVLTFTGSIPRGISKEECKKMLIRFKNAGSRIVIDCRSFTVEDIIECSPYLIKPNEVEISDYLGYKVTDFDQLTDKASDLHKKGIENAMISLGGKGALLVCSEGCFIAKPPKITPVSTVGAGDSSIAGFLYAASNGADASQRLRTAVAFGSAACLTTGSQPPLEKDTADLYGKITITRKSI